MEEKRRGRGGGCSLSDRSFWSVDFHSASCKGQVSMERERAPVFVCLHA